MAWWTAALAFLVYAAKTVWSFISPEAKLRRREVADAERLGREAVETERLDATYRRIEAEPPKPSDELVKDLNEKFRPRE